MYTTCRVGVLSSEISKHSKISPPPSLRSHLTSSPMGVLSGDYGTCTYVCKIHGALWEVFKCPCSVYNCLVSCHLCTAIIVGTQQHICLSIQKKLYDIVLQYSY